MIRVLGASCPKAGALPRAPAHPLRGPAGSSISHCVFLSRSQLHLEILRAQGFLAIQLLALPGLLPGTLPCPPAPTHVPLLCSHSPWAFPLQHLFSEFIHVIRMLRPYCAQDTVLGVEG